MEEKKNKRIGMVSGTNW